MPRWKWRLDATTQSLASKSKDPDLQKVMQALLRASEKARLLAEQTGTPFVVRQPTKTRATAGKHK